MSSEAATKPTLPKGVLYGTRGIYRDFEGDYWLFDGGRMHLLTVGPWIADDVSVRPSDRIASEFEPRPDLVEPFEWVGA